MSIINDGRNFSIALFVYTMIEFNLFQIYRTSVKKCEARLVNSFDNYKVPSDITSDVVKQFTVMPRIRTFIRDLFHADHHSDIKQGNLEDLFEHTIGVSGSAKKTLIDTMIRFIEDKLQYQFESGRNEELQHTYCREDNVIRSVYMPAVISLPIITLKLACDSYVSCHYERIMTDHVVYWIRNNRTQSTTGNSERTPPRVLVFICGIGVGPIIYFKLCQALSSYYEIIIMVEIKWISFHLMADPVEDRLLVDCMVEFLTRYMLRQGLGSFYKDSHGCDGSLSTANAPGCVLASEAETVTATLDLMMHSGGALYCRRLIERLHYTNIVLIEPACFLFGSSTATRQIYSYKSWFPLFQYPLVKNLPKLLDIAESVLQTDTALTNTIAVLSANDTLFSPGPCVQFLESFHPDIKVYLLADSGHGGAVSTGAETTCAIITKSLGYTS